MPDVITILQKWQKPITIITASATLLAVILVSILPKEYLSVATALPASSLATDKSAIFSENIQELYTSLGTPDELDRFLGTAALDTIYIATAKDLNLKKHYAVKEDNHALFNAARKLKKNAKVIRSEYGELKVQVWDKDRELAAILANTLTDKLQAIHQHLQNQSNRLVLQKLKEGYAAIQQPKLADSLTTNTSASFSNTAGTFKNEQLMRYGKLLSEYELTVATNPPALLVIEPARPALMPDKPYTWLIILSTFFAAALFSLLLATLLESRRKAA